MKQRRRQDGPVAPTLDRILLRSGEEFARLMIAGVLPSPLSVRGRATPLTGL
jgi:hypothetical protein